MYRGSVCRGSRVFLTYVHYHFLSVGSGNGDRANLSTRILHIETHGHCRGSITRTAGRAFDSSHLCRSRNTWTHNEIRRTPESGVYEGPFRSRNGGTDGYVVTCSVLGGAWIPKECQIVLSESLSCLTRSMVA